MAHAARPQANLDAMLGALQTFTDEAQLLKNSPYIQQDAILNGLRNDINTLTATVHTNNVTSTTNFNNLTGMIRDLTVAVRSNNMLLTTLNGTVPRKCQSLYPCCC